MTIDTDFHSHIAPSSAEQMIEAAKRKGLRVLGISEHIFQMSEVRPSLPHMPHEGTMFSMAEYDETVRSVAQRARFDARLGLEVDFIPGKNEGIQSFLQGCDWDFLIGSVHEIDGLLFESKRQWRREEGERHWLRYLALLREAVSCRAFSLVSHPVRMRVENAFLPPMFDEELERLAAEATRCDVALEINGFDVLNYPSLVRRLAKACALHNTPISVGSDAHRPAEVAQAHVQTEKMLQEAGIKRIRVWKRMEAED